MRLADIKKYLNTLLASFSSVLDLELTILQAGMRQMLSVMKMEGWFLHGKTAIRCR